MKLSLRFSRPLLRGAVVVLALAVSAVALHAHDFWLVRDAFRFAPGEWLTVRGQTSSRFPTSKAAVAVDRVGDARIFSAQEDVRIREISQAGTSLLLRHRPPAAGQRIVAVALHPRSLRESAAGFRRYLVLEGAPEALERYEREGKLPTDSITRRYTKYTKTLVEVGVAGPRAFGRVVGHTTEFVPPRDPASLSAGDSLPVPLLHRSQPLAGARVHAGSVPGLAFTEEERVRTLETDRDGVVKVPIDGAGIWNVRALHVVPADAGPGADWDTQWVTIVFGIEGDRTGSARPQAPETRPASGDSAAVAEIVHRFHAALEAGDSATALDLLTEDAIILENGSVETKQEYRSHHLPSDIAFARAVRREAGPIRVVVRGEVAWATSTSTARGTYRDREVNSQGAELMVLEQTPDGWRISAIHWSSRPIRS